MRPYPPLIVITGPESTGKTTLASRLAAELGLPLVSELARERLADAESRYTEADVYRLAILQYRQQMEVTIRHPLVLADTDLLTYRIWLDVRFGGCASWLQALHTRSSQVHYLLCTPDLPWIADPLRENPHDRQMLFESHLTILNNESWPYTIVSGIGQERTEMAWAAIRNLLV